MYIEVRLKRCINEQVCSSKEIVDDYFLKSTYSLAFINYYFDFNNFTDPIQSFIDDKIFFELDPKVKKSANVYI